MNKKNCLRYAVFVTGLLASVGCQPKEAETNHNPASTDDRLKVVSEPPKANSQATVTAGPLVVGAKAPDFEVETMGGGRLKLSEFVAETGGPSILLFDRAHW